MMTKQLTAILALALPFAASTAFGADDVAYCHALVAKYQAYIVKDSGHMPNHGTADGNLAAAQCAASNAAGIPVLEQKLRDAKIELPNRS